MKNRINIFIIALLSVFVLTCLTSVPSTACADAAPQITHLEEAHQTGGNAAIGGFITKAKDFFNGLTNWQKIVVIIVGLVFILVALFISMKIIILPFRFLFYILQAVLGFIFFRKVKKNVQENINRFFDDVY